MNGLLISVNHVNYGTLFATLIDGFGSLLTEFDEDEYEIPFMSTDEILRQLMRFGFYITYRVVEHLPNNILVFLNTINDVGFDKITRVALEYVNSDGVKIWRPTVLLLKSQFNDDLLTFDCKLSRKKFNEKLASNVIMNVTDEPDMKWDWVTYIANISDILDENSDPKYEFGSGPELPMIRPIHSDPEEGMTVVGSEEVVEDFGGDLIDAGNES